MSAFRSLGVLGAIDRLAPGVDPGAVGDPLARLGDQFDGPSATLTERGWSLYGGATVAAQSVSGGFASIVPTAGGAGGSFWFAAFDGLLFSKRVVGDCRMVASVRVRNAAGDANPPLTLFRIAGIAAHDPDRSGLLNYMHLGLGSSGVATHIAEAKTTEDSVSTFPTIAWPPGSVDGAPPLDGVLRLDRVGQVFRAFVAVTPSGPWSQVGPDVDRSGNPMPAALDWGLMAYAQPAISDVSISFERVSFGAPR